MVRFAMQQGKNVSLVIGGDDSYSKWHKQRDRLINRIVSLGRIYFELGPEYFYILMLRFQMHYCNTAAR